MVWLRRRRAAIIGGWWLAATFVLGCAEWKPAPPTVPTLPAPKLPADAAVVEILLLPMPPTEDFWLDLDEAAVDQEARLKWAQNGLRAGLSGAELPIDLLPSTAPGDEPAQDTQQVGSELSRTHRQIHCRPGQRYEVHPRSQLAGEHILLYRGREGIEGRQLSQPQPLFAMSVFPEGDGRLRIELTPEVQYGEFKQQWVSKDLAMRMDARREILMLDHTRMSAKLLEGQALIVAPMMPPWGLGELVLSGRAADGSTDQTVMVIRVARRATSEQL